jgi:hypothetical protein
LESALATHSNANKVAKSGKFSSPKNSPSTHHDSPQIHHDFTIKTPRKTRYFSPTPIKKSAHKPRKNRSMGAPDSLGYFRKKNYRG